MLNIFKTKDSKLVTWKKDYFHEMEGYKASIHIDKLADEFEMCHWQSGDPLGWIKIEGNNVNLKLDQIEGTFGASKDKINLSKGREIVVKIGYKLKEKYGAEPDYKTLHALFEPVFQNFYDDFYNDGVKIKPGFGTGGRRY